MRGSPRRSGARRRALRPRLRCACTDAGSTCSACAELRDRLVGPPLAHQRDAEIVVDVDRCRDRLQRDAEMLGGLGRLAGVDQRVGEVVLRVGILAAQAQRLLVGRHRFGDLSFGAQRRRRGCCRPARSRARARWRAGSVRSASSRRPSACSATPRFVSVTARISVFDRSGQLQKIAATATAARAAVGGAPSLACELRRDEALRKNAGASTAPAAANRISSGTSG